MDLYSEVKSWKKPLHKTRQHLALNYLKLLKKIQIIGITGSVGKTLTQNAIYGVLSQKFKVVVGDENLDPTFRIPKTILATKPWDEKIILEYGVEHPGEMDAYLKIVKPDIAVVTKISPTHLKYFKNADGVFREKSKLIHALGKGSHAILNWDDKSSHKLAKLTKAKVWFFGKSPKAKIKISHFQQNLSGSRFRIHANGQKATVRWKVVGKHQLLSAYAAATVGMVFSLTTKQIAKGLSQTKVPKHRLNMIVTKHINLIDDSYNSSPQAAEEAIKTLIDLGKGKKKAAILGEMKDLGDFSKISHQNLGGQIAKSSINYLITIGKQTEEIANTAKKNGFRGKIYKFVNYKEALKIAKKLISTKSLILVKGSRHAHMERIVLGLMHKSTHINCYHCGNLS